MQMLRVKLIKESLFHTRMGPITCITLSNLNLLVFMMIYRIFRAASSARTVVTNGRCF